MNYARLFPFFQYPVQRGSRDPKRSCDFRLVAVVFSHQLRDGFFSGAFLIRYERVRICVFLCAHAPHRAVSHQLRRQIVSLYEAAAHRDYPALYNVSQLACVPRPIVCVQDASGLGGYTVAGLIVPLGKLGDERIGKRVDIRLMLAQRDGIERDYIQPVKQIQPELSAVDIVLKVLVRGGDKAYIDGDGLAPADARYFALLQDAQQHALHIQRHLGDLVQKQRSAVGPLIPPGLLYVIYGVASGTPIASLFESGVIPGILVAIALMSVIFVLSRKPGCPWKTHEWKGWKHVLHCFKDAAFSIVAPFLTFVCIAAGITTATEAASVIIVFVLLVGTIVYKKIKFKDLLPMMIRSAVMSAAILMIASMAGVMGWVLAIDQIPQKICNLMISMTNSRIAVLFIIQIFLLFVGMFMDAAPAVLILVPVFMPIMKQYGIDPVHFGLLMCFNLTIGVLTPPVGTCLYTTAMATGVPVDRMIKGIWPWIGVLVVVLFICTYWEGLILFIPRLLGYGV